MNTYKVGYTLSSGKRYTMRDVTETQLADLRLTEAEGKFRISFVIAMDTVKAYENHESKAAVVIMPEDGSGLFVNMVNMRGQGRSIGPFDKAEAQRRYDRLSQSYAYAEVSLTDLALY